MYDPGVLAVYLVPLHIFLTILCAMVQIPYLHSSMFSATYWFFCIHLFSQINQKFILSVLKIDRCLTTAGSLGICLSHPLDCKLHGKSETILLYTLSHPTVPGI